MTERAEVHVREWLLGAEMGELREPPAEVAAHLHECVACSSELRRVLAGYRLLDEGLGRLTRRHAGRWRWAPLPLLAAAAAAAFLLAPHPERPPLRPSPLLAQLMFPDEPVVTPAPGQQAVVMQRNDMTVIWLTNFRGKP